jgi:hypothetical protein
MTHERIAVLSTSQCRLDTYGGPAGGRTIVKTEPSPLLTYLVKESYTIYLASTRPILHPKYDALIMEVIPEERRFHPDSDSEMGSSEAQGLIDMWARVLDTLGIPHPQPETYEGETFKPGWPAYRGQARDQGIVVGAGILRDVADLNRKGIRGRGPKEYQDARDVLIRNQ